jgi:hypothetical protein
MGGGVGTLIGRRITAIELPQMVAALHSVVGLAAVLTSIASVMADPGHADTLHLVTAYLGVLIGRPKLCFDCLHLGSLVRYRWCDLHRIRRRFLQARRKDVFATSVSTGQAPHQQYTFGYKLGGFGCICDGRSCRSGCGSCISGGKYCSELHQRFHDHGCHWRS